MESVLAQEEIYLRYEQLEITRRIITRFLKTKKKKRKYAKNIQQRSKKKKSQRKKKRASKSNSAFFIRSTIWLPITKKPLQVRMGKGKGAVDHWVFPSKGKSRVILEFSRQVKRLSRFRRVLNKLAKKTQVKKLFFDRCFTRKEHQVLFKKLLPYKNDKK